MPDYATDSTGQVLTVELVVTAQPPCPCLYGPVVLHEGHCCLVAWPEMVCHDHEWREVGPNES